MIYHYCFYKRVTQCVGLLMKASLLCISSLILLAQVHMHAKEETEVSTPKKTKEELLSQQSVRMISEAYGHFVSKSLDNPLLRLDFDAVVQGMNDAKANKPSPMTEQEYEEAITQIQELAFQENATKNLKEAEEFLTSIAQQTGVRELEPHRLYILTQKEGDGDELTENTTPVIHYTGTYANGTVFGSSTDAKEPISLSLNQTIPGFKRGILGMKVGEKRRIFIHPDLGYGISGQLLPNSLLIFDIELVRIDPVSKSGSEEEMDINSADEANSSAISFNEDEFSEEGDVDDDTEGYGVDEKNSNTSSY